MWEGWDGWRGEEGERGQGIEPTEVVKSEDRGRDEGGITKTHCTICTIELLGHGMYFIVRDNDETGGTRGGLFCLLLRWVVDGGGFVCCVSY
jgi:hypothetical protein